MAALPRRLGRALRLAVVLAALAGIGPAAAAGSNLARLLDDGAIALEEVYPGAERIGEVQDQPPVAPVYRDGTRIGAVFVNSDLANAVGYSGKPIHVAVGLSQDGVVQGAQMVEHSEPIVLIGIPEDEVQAFIDAYEGRNLVEEMQASAGDPADVDIISGATVTVMVIDDSVRRATMRVARALGYGGLARAAGSGGQGPTRTLVTGEAETADWTTLTGNGAVRRLSLDVADASRAFRQDGKPEAADRPESDDPQARFIDLYAGLASIPTVAKSLMGAREYRNFAPELEQGRDAVIIGGRGLYSFKGSGYVRGGVFDRIRLIQGQTTIRFRDTHHKRLAGIEAPGAPDLDEVGLFRIPKGAAFNPAEPWRLELLIQRNLRGRDKAFTTVELRYAPPDKYVEVTAPAASADQAGGADTGASPADTARERDQLWQRMWKQRIVDISILLGMLVLLTGMFFFQDQLVRRPRFASVLRYGFLTVVLVWLGFYANAQLSVVNILTFSNALLTDFSWTYFLMDPLIFILWFAVAAGLLFWGRGAFCGWLCPFGALQELTNHIGRRVGIPQVKVPWGLNERLWPIKYIIFLGLFGMSLYSLNWAETLSEVEPFKTAIILNFVRAWPFVAFAVALIVVNLFVERFFCRYLCPLGAALAIPARIRMFDWLKRHKECGNPCQICAHECPVDAIHPTGEINVNECIYCLECQKLYYDDQRCPPMIQKRMKREKRILNSSDSMLSAEGLAEKRRLQARRQEDAELKGKRGRETALETEDR
jgi:NosR/NirI family nitrous oxide reductase transcriptional regulator